MGSSRWTEEGDAWLTAAPAQEIDAGPVRLRAWRRSDGAALLAVINENFEHLHPWMEWAGTPSTRTSIEAFLTGAELGFERRTSFSYAILEAATARILGSIGLMGRVGPGGLEIGYWLSASSTGRGIATAAAAALTEAALAIPGVERVEIHCNEQNLRSAAVARRLGYRLDRFGEPTARAPAESGRSMIWIRSR